MSCENIHEPCCVIPLFSNLDPPEGGTTCRQLTNKALYKVGFGGKFFTIVRLGDGVGHIAYPRLFDTQFNKGLGCWAFSTPHSWQHTDAKHPALNLDHSDAQSLTQGTALHNGP